MFCTRCGIAVDDTARFCSQCGKATRAGGEGPTVECAMPKRLTRPMYEKKIGGVCAGFARYMDADITLIRVLWLLITIFSGIVPGLVVYLVAWIAMPADYSAPVPAGRPAGA